MEALTSLAEKLWAARRDGTTVEPDAVTLPANDQEAYAVQAEVMRLADAPASAFKVGSTSAEAQKILGTTEPGSCLVPAPYVFQSPTQLSLVADHMPALEGEFAFRLGDDLPARSYPYEMAEVAAAIDAVAGAIEVVGTRFVGGLAGKGRFLTTADSGANIALVTGPWTNDWQALNLETHPVALSINGQSKGSGTGARALGNPLNVMVWLANQQSTRGRGLNAGEIVSTGTCTGLDGIHPGDTAIADFGNLGKVEIAFR